MREMTRPARWMSGAAYPRRTQGFVTMRATMAAPTARPTLADVGRSSFGGGGGGGGGAATVVVLFTSCTFAPGSGPTEGSSLTDAS